MADPNLQNSQLCFITVAFPVSSDGEALRIKQAVSAALVGIEKAHIDFRLTSAPPSREGRGIPHASGP